MKLTKPRLENVQPQFDVAPKLAKPSTLALMCGRALLNPFPGDIPHIIFGCQLLLVSVYMPVRHSTH